jgi:curved DNA-binding protein CbpA
VLSRSGLQEAKAIAVLLSLRAKGLIAPARVNRPQANAPAIDAAMQEQIELDEARKREILEMERALEYQSHFELLGVTADAGTDEIRRAYHELSRKYHPDRFFKKNLGSFRSRVEKIFRKVTEAQSTLSDPQKREAYLKANPHLGRPAPKPGGSGEKSAPEAPERIAERKARLASHPYLQRNRKAHELIADAKALIAKGDYAKALGELDQLSRIDPRNTEAAGLLLTARRKQDESRAETELQRAQEAEMVGNLAAAAAAYRSAIGLAPNLHKAAFRGAALMLQLGEDSREAKALAQKAVDAEPKNASYRSLLARILLEAGFKKLAKKEYEEALKHDPDHAEAKAQLRKLRWTF